MVGMVNNRLIQSLAITYHFSHSNVSIQIFCNAVNLSFSYLNICIVLFKHPYLILFYGEHRVTTMLLYSKVTWRTFWRFRETSCMWVYVSFSYLNCHFSKGPLLYVTWKSVQTDWCFFGHYDVGHNIVIMYFVVM